MEEGIVSRVAEDSPHRCQANTTNGQCRSRAVRDGKCPVHMGSRQAIAKQEIRSYRLGKLQADLEHFVNDDQVKSLRAEIGILKLTLETVLNRCQDATELMMSSQRISDLVGRIEKLVMSCQRLEERTGQMLDRQTVMLIAARIINILDEHVPAEVLELVGAEIVAAIEEAGNAQGLRRESGGADTLQHYED